MLFRLVFSLCFVATAFLNQVDSISNVPPMANPDSTLSPFSSTFLHEVHNSSILEYALNSILDEPNKRNIFCDGVMDSATSLKMPDPRNTAQEFLNAIQAVSNVINLEMFSNAIASTMERFLNRFVKPLSEDQTKAAEQFAKKIEAAIRSHGPAPSALDCLQGLADGSIEFLSPFNVLTPETASIYADIYLEEMNRMKNHTFQEYKPDSNSDFCPM